MNLIKAFVELNLNISFKELTKHMGWRSDAAQQCAKRCNDNHKTWQLIQVYFLAKMQGLVFPYVKECINLSETQTPNDFIVSFASEKCSSSPTFALLFEMTFKYTTSIINFRTSIRRNNALLVKSARYMTRGLFHGRNHPRYQAIEVFNSSLEEVPPPPPPPEIQRFMATHQSVSKSG